VSSSSMRVRVLYLTSGIRAVLSCSLNISCSSPYHASLGPQPAAGTPIVPTHPSFSAQMSSSTSEVASSPRSSPPTSAPCSKDSLSARSPRVCSTGRRLRLPRQRNASERRQRLQRQRQERQGWRWWNWQQQEQK
jgi:hypothetical protein